MSCVSRKGGTGGGGWVHPKGGNSMAASRLVFRSDLVGTGRMSVNADISTLLKCLASGKKSIEQLCPSGSWQTSALELALFSSLLLPHTSCIFLCTILWNVNFITCAWSLSPTPLVHGLDIAYLHVK